jgi:transposase InsO family protein
MILSSQALLRYQVVSQVEARVLAGKPLAAAIREVLALPHVDLQGRRVSLSERTLYRWTASYQGGGVGALEPKERSRVEGSAVLSSALLGFLCVEKQLDPFVSVPEMIERARRCGVLAEDEPVSRITVWRACRRLGLPLRRRQSLAQRDMRPFAYPHRMLMVLADGKHFRAGLKRRYRVALTFLDDATRYGLGVRVGTSESTELFLHGLHEMVLRHGPMKALFVDHGPGFISEDTARVVAQLPCRLIHGTAAYPEGHGKIEKFHQLLIDRVLRGLDGNPEVDAEPQALTLRLSHWLREIYNHRPHEALGGDSPAQRWHADARPLELPGDRAWLDAQFLLTFTRRVRNDNAIPYEGVDYEVPRGYAGQRLTITRHLLQDDALSIVHHGRRVRLHPVDLTANAYDRRGRGPAAPEPPSAPPRTAAQMAFDDHFAPLVDGDGGYNPPPREKGDPQ